MKTLPLSNNGATETKFHVNDDEFVIETVQDVQPILEQNRIMQNDTHNPKAIGRHAARIPVTVMQQWMKDFKAIHKIPYYQAPAELRDQFRRQRLNDRDWAKLRTWQGKL